MIRYSYRALDANGRKVTGVVEAASEADATAALDARGLTTLELAISSKSAAAPQGDQLVLKSAALVGFTHQLATLLSASVPLDDALRLIAGMQPRSRLAVVATRLGDEVTAGRPLSVSMSRVIAGCPAHIIALVAAGESRGAVGAALAEAAKLLERGSETRARVRSALIYPLVLLIVALGAVGIVVTVLAPALLPLFEDTGRTPPMALAWPTAIAAWWREFWPWVLVVIIAMVIAFSIIARMPDLRRARDRAWLSAPFIGTMLRCKDTAAIARSLGALLAAGVPLTEALNLAASVPSNSHICHAIEDAGERVKAGAPLSRALAVDGVLDPVAVRFIALGEQSSQLDVMLLHLADATEHDGNRRLEMLMTLLSPALTVLIGAFVGALILPVLQAILSVNDLVTR